MNSYLRRTENLLLVAEKKSESPQVTSSVRKRKRVADSDDDSASEPEKSASAEPQPNKKAVLKYVAPSRKVMESSYFLQITPKRRRQPYSRQRLFLQSGT